MSVRTCLFGYLRRHGFLSVTVIFVILAVTLLSLVPPQILKRIIDEGIALKNYPLLFRLAFWYLVSYILIGLFGFLKDAVLIIASQGITREIREKMMKHLFQMTYFGLTQKDTGEFESYFSNDVDAMNTLITSGIVSMAIDFLKIVGIIISIFLFHLYFGLITLAILPIVIFLALLFRKLMFTAQMQNRDLEGNVNDMVLEALENHKTIKAFRVYDFIYSRYRKILEKHYRTTEHANFYDSIFAPMMQILKTLVIAVIIISATAKPTVFGVTVGVLIGFIDLITGLFAPIETIGMELQTVQTSIAGIRRVNAFFRFEAKEKHQVLLSQTPAHVLEFHDVSFRYGTNNEVISHFRLKLSGNQHLTIRGASGAGKSTVFRLAYGILTPTTGMVTIDGISCSEISPESRKKLFGILFQETFFSGGTVYEELTLADSSVSEDAVWKALKLVGLDKRIENLHQLPAGKLSAGEEVLFNLARLIIIDAPIWFLDEMNAKIDPETAAYIIHLISELGREKMILSINHYGENLQDSGVITLTDLSD